MNVKTIIPFMLTAFLLGIACNNQSTKNEEIMDTTKQVTNNEAATPKLLTSLESYLDNIEENFARIPEERKNVLKKAAQFVKAKSDSGDTSNLIFICTHNSRRSHMSQLWAQVASYYYGIDDVHCYSGGTEATAFNPRSVKALRKAGFDIEQTDTTSNPVYLVKYADDNEPVKGFSKKYDDNFNPKENFAALMTCSEADEACPIVFGAAERISIPYEDPKVADNTLQEEERYDERCKQICVEMFYTFSQVKI